MKSSTTIIAVIITLGIVCVFLFGDSFPYIRNKCDTGQISGTRYNPVDEAVTVCYPPLANAGQECADHLDCMSSSEFEAQGACRISDDVLKARCTYVHTTDLYTCDEYTKGTCSAEFFGDYHGYSILGHNDAGKILVGTQRWGP